jgi:HAD superfamily hydrolase (TIGR01484 family)
VRPIESLGPGEANRLRGLLFDLDDTLLDAAELRENAYSALFRLRESGLLLVAVTGRPAGWGSVLVRQWPVAAMVCENGAVAVLRRPDRADLVDSVDAEVRRHRRERLLGFARHLQSEFPELQPTDDVNLRATDYTFDIGEQARVDRMVVNAAARQARVAGFRTTVSTVHLHVTLDADDKASGAIRTLRLLRDVDPTAARWRYGYVGDSENDSPCFAAFHTTIAPANLRGRPTVPPRFITRESRGAGFAEAAAVISERRRAP